MTVPTRERIAAATGVLVVVALAISFIITISPRPPSLTAPTSEFQRFFEQNQDGLRVAVLLNTIAILLFLWFLGSVRAALASAEGGARRVSAIASGGGLVGAGFVLLSQVFLATALLDPGATGAEDLRLLAQLASLSLGVGAAAFTVLFFATAVSIQFDRGLPAFLGALSLLAGIALAIGVVTPFATEGVFNPQDGAFGFWVRYAAFVVWVLVASVVLLATAGGRPRRR